MKFDFYKMIKNKDRFFFFKQFPWDFIVEEKLFSKPCTDKGHVFFVFFEKKYLNTMDVIHFLSKNLNLKRKHFGIAGLKDKF